ncbi:MAG: EAL domain-containing protein [Pseudomonadales bacterium]
MLFKSLRERILVFFSLLIIGMQLVSFAVVTSTSRDAETRQLELRAAEHERVVAGILEAEYTKMESTLYSAAVAHVGKLWGSEPDLFERPGAALRLSSERQPAGSLLLYSNSSGATWYAPQQTDLLPVQQEMLAKLPIGTGSGLQRSAFLFGQKYYLLASLSGSRVFGNLPENAMDGTLAIAVPFEQSVVASVKRTLGLELQAGGKSQTNVVLTPLQPEAMPEGILRAVPLALKGRDNGIEAKLQRQKNVLMLLMAAALLLTLMGGYALADELTRPLKLLTQKAAQIKSGDYSLPAEKFQQDEIGQLASTLSHMCETIAEREQKIIGLAYADSLTGLPNRALFEDRLNQAVSQNKRSGGNFSVVLMDLDRFKYINDVLGHEAGDFVLCEVARRLESVLRESDTVARLGGDEFAMLLAGGSEYHVQAAINKIMDVFDEPVTLNSQSLDVACSLGVASFPAHGEDPSLLLRRADMAMYAAKRFNAGFSYYTPECDQHQEQHLSLLGDIKRAVENDELQLFYQPKIDLACDKYIAVETLLRWQHPRQGLVPPQEFIPFAEHTGAIRLITRWLIDRAIKQCGQWLGDDLVVQMSLNISARDLIDPDFPALVSKALQDNKVPAELICLEITESALMQDPAKARRTLDVLTSMGVKISIDDYGTGYSSLAYVKNLPVKELKIDREFVSNMLHNAEDNAIVKSTIELGHNLGMRVVAEGIENAGEMALLKSYGCDQGQGFLISHALSAAELERWYRQRSLDSLFGDASLPEELPAAADEAANTTGRRSGAS